MWRTRQKQDRNDSWHPKQYRFVSWLLDESDFLDSVDDILPLEVDCLNSEDILWSMFGNFSWRAISTSTVVCMCVCFEINKIQKIQNVLRRTISSFSLLNSPSTTSSSSSLSNTFWLISLINLFTSSFCDIIESSSFLCKECLWEIDISVVKRNFET